MGTDERHGLGQARADGRHGVNESRLQKNRTDPQLKTQLGARKSGTSRRGARVGTVQLK